MTSSFKCSSCPPCVVQLTVWGYADSMRAQSFGSRAFKGSDFGSALLRSTSRHHNVADPACFLAHSQDRRCLSRKSRNAVRTEATREERVLPTSVTFECRYLRRSLPTPSRPRRMNLLEKSTPCRWRVVLKTFRSGGGGGSRDLLQQAHQQRDSLSILWKEAR